MLSLVSLVILVSPLSPLTLALEYSTRLAHQKTEGITPSFSNSTFRRLASEPTQHREEHSIFVSSYVLSYVL